MNIKNFFKLTTGQSLRNCLGPVVAVCLVGCAAIANAQTDGINVNVNGTTVSVNPGQTVSGTTNGIVTTADNTAITNDGTVAGGFNGVNFVNGQSSGSLDNNGSITSGSRGVNIGGAVDVDNSGSILGTGDQRNGTVYSDSVANNFSVNNSGTIDAGAGNQGSGLALEIGSQTTASITNSGTIQGRTNTPDVSSASGASGDGLRLANFGGAADRVFNGSITNTATGVISSESESGTTAGFRAANTIGFQGTLDNAGLIEGVQNGVYFGNAVNGLGGDHTGGVVNNTGRIESGSRALNIDGVGLTINNSGSITGTGDQRNGTVYADSTSQNFTLNNSGSIDAGADNLGAGFSVELSAAGNAFTIDNSGTIEGRGNAGAGVASAGDGIRLERTRNLGMLDGSSTGLFTGTINNSGTISTTEGANGTVSGLRAVNGVNFQGTLTNAAAGTISGTQNGVYFGTGDHTGGTVDNAGTITSDSRAFNIDGDGLTLNNSGLIAGTDDQRNGTVYSDSTADNFTVNNSGTIDAGAGNQGSGLALEIGSQTTASITNSGTIQGRTNTADVSSASGASGDGLRLANFGGAADRVFDGDITNTATGVISSESESGTTAGFRAANTIGFQGTLDNAGLIEGVQNGVYFGNAVNGLGGDHTGGVVNNTGRIESGSRALNIDGDGLTVNNSGSITGTGNQRNGTVYADSTSQNFTLNNSGSIDAGAGNLGAGFSVELSATGNTFTIDNSGTIEGRGNAGAGLASAGDGIRLERTRNLGMLDGSSTGLFTGTINNSGTISTTEGANGTVSGLRAVNGVNFQGTLTNAAAGTISGTQNGVYFGTGDHTGGTVDNAGTITSDSRAFNIDGDGLTLNNSGLIAGTGAQRNGTVYVDGTADNFTVNNSGTIDAAGQPNGSGSGLSVQVGINPGDVQNGNVVNSGLIAGSGTATIDAGLRFFTGASSATFAGDITNDQSGVITGGSDAAAVLFESDTSFDGTLTNDGRIDGSIFLNDGDLVLGDSSVLELEISSLTDFESVETTGAITFDGILDLTFANGFTPVVGQTFDLFDFGSIQGAGLFDQIVADGFILDSTDVNVGGSVSILAVAVPEPSSMAILALAGGLLGLRRRRQS